MAAYERASLLGLPRELRLQIYNELFTTSIKCTMIKGWRDKFITSSKSQTDYGFKAEPILGQGLQIPWLNLMLTCKAIAEELQAAMSESAFLDRDANRTYVLDLDPGKRFSATWTRIPCRPSQTKILVANFHFSERKPTHFWGDGGPMPIVRNIYQVLNHFIHCGPRLDAQRQLDEPLHLQRVDVVVLVDADDDEHAVSGDSGTAEPSGRRRRRRTGWNHNPFARLCGFVSQIVGTGVMFGFVDSIHVSGDDEEPREWAVEQQHDPGIPAHWKGYGFEWGMQKYQSEQ